MERIRADWVFPVYHFNPWNEAKKTYLSLKLAHLQAHEKVPQTESVLENPFDKVSLKLNS